MQGFSNQTRRPPGRLKGGSGGAEPVRGHIEYHSTIWHYPGRILDKNEQKTTKMTKYGGEGTSKSRKSQKSKMSSPNGTRTR